MTSPSSPVLPSSVRTVGTAVDFVAAANAANVQRIIVAGRLADVPATRLRPGQAVHGAGTQACIRFAAAGDGLQLTRDNEIRGLRLEADADRLAIWNDTACAQLGTLALRDVATIGAVRIVASDQVRGGHVSVHGLDVIAADTRAATEGPAGFGVRVLQGAFTLWNRQSDPAVVITTELSGLCAGRPDAPVRGSGIFVSGAGERLGRVQATLVETGPVYSDGGIPAGTADVISGGVFIVHGTRVDAVRNLGPVVTYGVNDMVLDNWGSVDAWTAYEGLASHGASGIGFVNFGVIHDLRLRSPVETFGPGARGFNVYAGTVDRTEIDRIVTHADGAIGVQVGRPIGSLVVHRGIETFGGAGPSLVQGVVVQLAAHALSVKPGGSIAHAHVHGGIRAHGAGVAPLDLRGEITALRVDGAIRGEPPLLTSRATLHVQPARSPAVMKQR